MFTKWQQVEDWIMDNHFQRWIFYKNNPDSKADGERSNDKIVDSKFYNDQDDKLLLTQKYLEQWGGRAYGIAFQSTSATTGGAQCVVCIESAAPQPQQQVQSVAAIGNTVDVDAIKAEVREQVKMEYEKQDYERKRKELDQERKEFERDKSSAIGVMIGYLKPVIEAIGQKRVAGVDAPNDVQARRITPIDEPAQEEQAAEEQEPSVFTDEEGEQLCALMARFKAVEPDYMQLLEAVVQMAESGDRSYQMAREFVLNAK